MQHADVVEGVSNLEEVFRAEGSRMWRALFAYTGDREVASDALAEGFAQALARGDDLRSPAAWIWQAVFRIAAGDLKRRRRSSTPTLEYGEEMPESVRDLVAALQTISPKQRAAVVLHDYADLPSTEVASLLGISAATVRVHLSQGRRHLRKLLEGYR